MNLIMRMINQIWKCPHCQNEFHMNRKMNAYHAIACAQRIADAKAADAKAADAKAADAKAADAQRIIDLAELEKKRVQNVKIAAEQKAAVDAVQPQILTIDSLGSNGRLGNQMFQVASAIGLAQKHGLEVVLPPWYCNYTKKHISQFFENPVMQVALAQIQPIHNYQEVSFTYHDVPVRPNMRIKGYFQSEKYFEHSADLVRRHFKPANHVLTKLVRKYGQILDSGTICAVHVRRGDYVNNPIHSVCDLQYYNRAIEYINQRTHIDKFLIFSDDILWCKQNMVSEKFIFIADNLDIEDIFLMSMCDHYVISNSSFSWWGSWLSSNDQKIIVAPPQWFSHNSNMVDRDIYTKNMIKL